MSRPAGPSEGSDVVGVRPSAVSATSAWFFLGGATIVLGAAIVTNLLAPAVLLDVVALWPVGALGIVLAPIAWFLRRRSPVLPILVPLLLLTWVLAGVGWFFADGVGDPPSRAADVTGPDTRPSIGALELAVGGELVVDDLAGADYRVSTSRSGGTTPAPETFDAEGDDTLGVVVRERSDPGWYASAGWRLGLRTGPEWTLDLTAERIDADLTAVTLGSLRVAADGRVALPAGGGAVSVLEGTLTLVIPAGTPTHVDGPAVVPDGWVDAGDGAVVTIAVDGGSVTIVEGRS